MRDQATNAGDSCSTAILIRKYGMPHSTEQVAKAIQARRDTGAMLAAAGSPRHESC